MPVPGTDFKRMPLWPPLPRSLFHGRGSPALPGCRSQTGTAPYPVAYLGGSGAAHLGHTPLGSFAMGSTVLCLWGREVLIGHKEWHQRSLWCCLSPRGNTQAHAAIAVAAAVAAAGVRRTGQVRPNSPSSLAHVSPSFFTCNSPTPPTYASGIERARCTPAM